MTDGREDSHATCHRREKWLDSSIASPNSCYDALLNPRCELLPPTVMVVQRSAWTSVARIEGANKLRAQKNDCAGVINPQHHREKRPHDAVGTVFVGDHE